MIIATTYQDGTICGRFGQTPSFKVYTARDGAVVASEVRPVAGAGHMALTTQLVDLGVDVLICGGLGAPAAEAVKAAGIDLYAGFSGDADAVVDDYLAGRLVKDEQANLGHRHGHGKDDGCCSGE